MPPRQRRYAEIALLDGEHARFVWWAVEVSEAPRIAEPLPGLESHGAVYELSYLAHDEPVVTELDGLFTHTPRWRWLSQRPTGATRPATEVEVASFLDEFSETTFSQLRSRAGQPPAWHSGYVMQSLNSSTLCVEWTDGWLDAVPVSATKDTETWRWNTYQHEGTIDAHKRGRPIAAFIEPPVLRYSKFEWPGLVAREDTGTVFATEKLEAGLLIPLIESPVRGMSVHYEKATRSGAHNCVLIHLPLGSVPQPRYFAHQSKQEGALSYLATIRPIRNGELLVAGKNDAAQRTLMEQIVAHGAQFPDPWLPPKTFFRRLVVGSEEPEPEAKPAKPKPKPAAVRGSHMKLLDGIRDGYRRAFIKEMVKCGRIKTCRLSKVGIANMYFDNDLEASIVTVPTEEVDNATLLLDSALREAVSAANAVVEYHGTNVRRRAGSTTASKLQTNITPLLSVTFADGRRFHLTCSANWKKYVRTQKGRT